MNKPWTLYAGTYATVLGVMLVLDLLWLGVVAKPLYQQAIGHLMAERPNVPAALLFYAVFAAGLTLFGVLPQADSSGWQRTVLMGGLFGFFAYATYDLTNLATLKDWPIGISLIDMAWGTTVSAVSALAGKWAFDRLAA